MDHYLLTDEEMAEVQGDKEACIAIIHGFGSCAGCSAHCLNIAKAQLQKVVKWGNEPCPHQTNPLEFRGKQYCAVCWQELVEEANNG